MRTIVLLVTLCILTGCQFFGNNGSEEPFNANGERKPAPKRVALIEQPRSIREDIIYPDSTKQSFYWRDRYSEWRFNFPRKGYAYAGFRIRIPLNLSRGIDKYELSFTIKPKSKAQRLWVALVDGDDTEPNTLVELPIKPYLGSTLGLRKHKVSIPIRDFPVMGVPVKKENGSVTTEASTFDWKDVRQIRIINHGGTMPSGDIVITDISIDR